MMDTVTTLATIPAILALVNLAKRVGLPANAALVLAVALGVALNTADYLWADNLLYQAIADGLIRGLGAAGLYDVAKPKPAKLVVDDGKPGRYADLEREAA